MIKTQLNRAQKLKIHFCGNSEQCPRHQIEMFRLLAEHSLRWEELIIELTPDILPLLVALRNCVASLRRLRIQWQDVNSQAGVETIDCFRTAPSLTDVGISNRYRHVPISLPAHQLTRYHLDAPWTVREGILKSAPNLAEACINILFSQSLPQSSTVIDLLSLRRLYVSHSRVLDPIRVPDLEELAVRFRKDSGPKVLGPLESLLVRSACSLRRICLRGSPDIHTITEILRKAPSVVDLTILLPRPDDNGSVNTLMAALTIRDFIESTSMAPQLRSLFFGCEDDNIDYAVYLGMLQSRWKAGDCGLKAATLLIDSGPGPDPATIDGLQSLRQDGLDLAVLEAPEAHAGINRWIFA
ncbi:hypothetical protein DFH09DRAFT_1326746 [Mycena vulgaris]|nr:hypothetical protein DFH09DRAFT_1326746 [Mycena vulgaris]